MLEGILTKVGGFLSPIKMYLYGIVLAISTGFIIWFNIIKTKTKEQEEKIKDLQKEVEDIKVNNIVEVEAEKFNTKQEAIKENIDKKITKTNIKQSEVKDEENDSKLTFII